MEVCSDKVKKYLFRILDRDYTIRFDEDGDNYVSTLDGLPANRTSLWRIDDLIGDFDLAKKLKIEWIKTHEK